MEKREHDEEGPPFALASDWVRKHAARCMLHVRCTLAVPSFFQLFIILFYFILLYFIIFYYILLYFIIFYYILLYFIIFYYILLYLFSEPSSNRCTSLDAYCTYCSCAATPTVHGPPFPFA
jgi:hypothetical protein